MGTYEEKLIAEAQQIGREFEAFSERMKKVPGQESSTHDEILKSFMLVELAKIRLVTNSFRQY